MSVTRLIDSSNKITKRASIGTHSNPKDKESIIGSAI